MSTLPPPPPGTPGAPGAPGAPPPYLDASPTPTPPTAPPRGAIGGVVLGVVVLAVYAVANLLVTYVGTEVPEAIPTSPEWVRRWWSATPEAALAVALLLAGLADRRWLRGPIAALVALAAGVVPAEVSDRLTRWAFEDPLNPVGWLDEAYLAIAIASTCIAVLAWGLARRRGRLWVAALVPGWAVLIGAGYLAREVSRTASSFEEYERLLYAQAGIQVAAVALAVALGWLAERIERPASAAGVVTR